jgi:hypothetical protein
MVWVDFNHWSKSTTPVNAQHLIISRGCQSIRTTEGLDVNQTLGGVQHSSTIFGSSTFAQLKLSLPHIPLSFKSKIFAQAWNRPKWTRRWWNGTRMKLERKF